MRLYGAFTKAEVQSDGTVRLEGIASSETEDDQGETVQAAAMRAAIPEYMRFPALREMHQLSAAGTTLEADVGHDGVTRIVGHIIDPVAISKIKNRVYRGFSIGGQVTGRDPVNRKIITGLKLNEISLVDRPANPEAIFDVWKAGGAIIEGNNDMPDGGLATLGDVLAAKASAGEPVQIWSCRNAEHRHLAKADAVRCIEDEAAKATADPSDNPAIIEDSPAGEEGDAAPPASAAQPEPQSALDMARAAIERGEAVLARAGANTEAAAVDEPAEISDSVAAAPEQPEPTSDPVCQPAEKATDDTPAGDDPPSADDKPWRPPLAKGLANVGRIANLIIELDWVCDGMELESAMEGDNSPQPARLMAIIGELCTFLNAYVAEETAEFISEEEYGGGDDDEYVDVGGGVAPLTMSSIISSLRKTISDPDKLEALVNGVITKGALLEAADQIHLDYAVHYALEAMEMDGLTKSELTSFAEVYKVLIDTGATSVAAPAASGPPRNATQDTSRNARVTPLQPPDGAVPATPMPKASDITRLHNAIAKASELPEDGTVQVNADLAMKAGRKPQHIMAGMIHDCLKALSSGTTCDDETEAGKTTKKISGRTMAAIHKAHEHIGRVPGGECPGGEPTEAGEEERQGASSSAGKTIETDDLAKAQIERDEARAQLVKSEAENTAMAKALTAMTTTFDRMAKQIDDIYHQPVAPIGIVRTGTPTTKAADNAAPDDPTEITDAQAVAWLAKKSPEQQTLAMIKASYATPMPLPASVVGHSQAARDRVPNR
jgi:hypothetical protein